MFELYFSENTVQRGSALHIIFFRVDQIYTVRMWPIRKTMLLCEIRLTFMFI